MVKLEYLAVFFGLLGAFPSLAMESKTAPTSLSGKRSPMLNELIDQTDGSAVECSRSLPPGILKLIAQYAQHIPIRVFANNLGTAILTSDGVVFTLGCYEKDLCTICPHNSKRITIPRQVFFCDSTGQFTRTRQISDVALSKDQMMVATCDGKPVSPALTCDSTAKWEWKEWMRIQPKQVFADSTGGWTGAISIDGSVHLRTLFSPDENNPKRERYFSEYGSSVVSLALGYNHAAAATADGAVHSWNYSEVGASRLGNEDSKHQPLPQKIQFFDEHAIKITKVLAGHAHTLALSNDGKVFSWGSNKEGQLGLGSPSPTKNSDEHSNPNPDRLVPQEVVFPLEAEFRIVDIASGSTHNLALASNGKVYSWGTAPNGGLGHGDQISLNIPTEIMFFSTNETSIVGIAAGTSHSVALASDGRIFTWGSQFLSESENFMHFVGTPSLLTVPLEIQEPDPALPLRVTGIFSFLRSAARGLCGPR